MNLPLRETVKQKYEYHDLFGRSVRTVIIGTQIIMPVLLLVIGAEYFTDRFYPVPRPVKIIRLQPV